MDPFDDRPQRSLNVMMGTFLVLSLIFGIVLVINLDTDDELVVLEGAAGSTESGRIASDDAESDVADPVAVSGGGSTAGNNQTGGETQSAGGGGTQPGTTPDGSTGTPSGTPSGDGGSGRYADIEGPTTGISDSTIRIGATVSASGPVAFPEVITAIKAAVAAVNRDGGINGKQLELTALDDGLDANRGEQNVRRLIDQEGVFALVGNYSPFGIEKAIPFLEQRRVPAVPGSSLAIGEFVSPMVYNAVPGLTEQAEAFCRKGLETFPNSRRAGIVFVETAITIKLAQDTEKCLRANGVTDVTSEQISLAQVDFTATVLRLQGDERNLVFPLAENKSQVRLFQAMDRQQYDPDIVGNNATNDPAIRDLTSKAAEGALVPSPMRPLHADHPSIATLRSNIEAVAPGQADTLTFWAQQAYVGVLMFADVARSLGDDLNRESLIAALNDLEGYVAGGGLTPPITYGTEANHRARPTCISYFRITSSGFGPPSDFRCS